MPSYPWGSSITRAFCYPPPSPCCTHHALVPVREQHYQGALPHPLGLPAADELVDDALGGVGEVSELRLPYHKRVRTSERVSELEAEHGVLGQGAVVDDVLGLVGRQVVQRDRDHLVAHLVVKHVVPVAATRINVIINGKLRDFNCDFQNPTPSRFSVFKWYLGLLSNNPLTLSVTPVKKVSKFWHLGSFTLTGKSAFCPIWMCLSPHPARSVAHVYPP